MSALVLVAMALLLVSASLAWATVNDYQSRGVVPNGVTVVGKDLGGMTEADARAAIEEAVATPLLRPLTVVAANKSFTFEPKGIVTIDVDGMLADAYAPRRDAPLVARVQHDVAGTPLPAEIKPKYTVDQAAITNWLAGVQAQVDTKPANAERIIKKYKLVVKPSVVGLKTDVVGAQAVIVEALNAESALSETASRTVAIPVAATKPKIEESSFKKTLVVSLSQRKVRLYNGAKLQKTYRIAIGQPAFPDADRRLEDRQQALHAHVDQPGKRLGRLDARLYPTRLQQPARHSRARPETRPASASTAPPRATRSAPRPATAACACT